MALSFENLWRQARNLFPGVPALVVRQWAQDAYGDACAYTPWAFLRNEGFLITQAARAVDVLLTQGSATVTSAGLFVASDQGRQFRVGSYPVYTIRTFTDVNTIVLDKAYVGASSVTASAQILDAYATLPDNFANFLVIWNPYEQRILPYWVNQDQLAWADPARTISDSGPRFVVAYKLSGEPSTLGQPVYEYHPYPTAARQYPYLYTREAEQMADSQLLPGVFYTRTDVLKIGIELKAARWPGTTDQPNPYFNLGNYDRISKEWDKKLQDLALADDEQFPQQFQQMDWAKLVGYGITHNTNWLRQTDADLSSFV